MPNNSPFVASVNELLAKLEDNPTVDTGIELANQIVLLLGDVHTKSVEDVFESSIELPNAERYDSWFQPHPIFKSDRACFDLADSPLLQAKFYWLKKRSRQIIAGGVHFTPNYEDEEFTHNERYKVGLDFFLSPNGKSLQVVLSNRGNLRIVELAGRLNNTQKEIFEKWQGAGSLHTQEALHTTLWESFKLKSVNQKFYDGVSNSFTELLQHLKSIDKDEEEAKLFASRLLGRLLFCWFLRKKGIIDESVGYFNAQGADATAYYKQSLERLFFLTLNTPIDERDELTKQHQKALFPELLVDDQPSLFKTDQKTPYLNGGLFEPHDNDWYKDDSLTLPEGFFTNLYDHFEEFNFTTDESSPEYEQIAIDPEMLGRVFESLLATQVDETGQQARKAKGTFYTPREIVSYMCKESLRNYLYNAVNNDEGTKESIDSLLDITDSEWAKSKSNTLRDKVKDNRTQIINALDAVTILDPACGSGAFPMGMLQLMLKTYERLESRFDPYKTKLSVIQNNIFGVDIEPMAVEISRLRAWLSLIVDEDDPRSVDPLPNLDFKFVCANSLRPLEDTKQVDWLNSANSDLHERLTQIRKEYFAARKPHTKKAAQGKYYKLTKAPEGIFDDNRTRQLKSFDPFKSSYSANFFDADYMFGVNNGFDVIIGNPPYVSIWKINTSDKKFYEKEYDTAKGHYDLYVLFYEISLRTLSSGGFLCFITSNKWMAQNYGQALRKLFLRKHVLKLLDFSAHQVFESATVDTQITIVENCDMTEDYEIEAYCHKEKSAPNFNELSMTKLHTSIFRQNDELNFKISLTNESVKLLNKIDHGSMPLECLLYTSKGAELHNTKEKIKKEVYIHDDNPGGLVRYIEGKYFDKYQVKTIKYLDYQPTKHKAPAFPELFEARKIIVKNLVGRGGIQAILDETKLYNNDALINAVPYHALSGLEYRQVRSALSDEKINLSKHYPLEFLLAIINSKLSSWYFMQLYANGLHFYPRHLRSIRVPLVEGRRDEVEEITKLVRHLSQDIHENDRITMVSSIDRLVYKLFGLTPEEIQIIEEDVE